IVSIRFATPVSNPTISEEPEIEWTIKDSKAYAQDKLYEWQHKQWTCLNKLWTKESNWRPNAYNKIKVMGKNAGGIPQILGLDPKTPAPIQIDRGLSYIYNRYQTPCLAWEFFTKKGYY
ncbi:MAG: hypothetical protein EB127_26775, partial [Alphaproteobacteria bacterium]|nr:hypothetical protein [Alphaproteobacteria bacterium]